MSDQEEVTEDDILKRLEDDNRDYAVHWLRQHWDGGWSSSKMNKHHKAFKYGKPDEYGHRDVIKVDFSKVHGKDRKHIKFHWKQNEKAVRSQMEMWNRYVGKNVLYVHARLGSTNWSSYEIDTKHPMYLEHIDDAFDTSYCDIYYDLDKGVSNEGQ